MNKLLVFLLLIFVQIGSSQIDGVLADQLQQVLNQSVSDHGNNGVSAHLIMPDGQIWSGVAGLGQQNIPISDTTLFHGASTTKFNMAALMLLLVEDNLIELDKSWSHYVSLDVEFDTSITIRHLLNHTSGIADYLETANSGNDITSDFNKFFTPQNILEEIVSAIPDFAPGTNFRYSNSNYTLAALIVESVTGNPVHIALRNRIWDPLNMDHTYFGAYESYTEPTAGVWWNFGSGLTNYSDSPSTSMLSYAYGAGNIVSCPKDLALLLSSVLDGKLISAESLNEMLTFIPSSVSSWTAGYGLGIHHFNQQDDEVVGHDGYYTNLTDMFHSMNCGFTLVTMSNTQSSWFGIFSPMYDLLIDYCSTNTALDEFENKIDLNIFPNPSSNQFNINCQQVIHEIKITDLAGMIHHHTYPFDKRTSVILNREGLYFVTINSNDQTITKKLLVKN